MENRTVFYLPRKIGEIVEDNRDAVRSAIYEAIAQIGYQNAATAICNAPYIEMTERQKSAA